VEILDSQVHAPLPLRAWDRTLNDATAAEVSVELLNAAMEAVGVGAAMVYGSVETCEIAVERYPGRFRGVASVGDAEDVESPDTFVDALVASPAIVGLRILGDAPVGAERRRLFAEGHWESLLDVAEDRGMPVVVFAPLRTATIAGIAVRHPRLRLVVDHLGLPPPPSFPRVAVDASVIADLVALASLPTVAVKLSGAPALSAKEFPFDDVRPMVRAVLDAFGSERVMWGSDFTRVTGRNVDPPHPGGRHTYTRLLEYITDTDLLRPEEMTDVLGGSARRWFDWPQ
jgi:L-fuconolactonase